MFQRKLKQASTPKINEQIHEPVKGNLKHVPTWVKGLPLQPKLTINQPGDEYEQEADLVAEQVMRTPAGPAAGRVQRCACGGIAGPDGECEACKAKRLGLQRKADGIAHTEAPPSVHQTLHSSGQPLDTSTRSFMEPRFGQDFSNVRVHTDSQAALSAADVSAKAYTVGNDIAFGSGEYAPGTSKGNNLIAHELTHTLQQTGENNTPIQMNSRSYTKYSSFKVATGEQVKVLRKDAPDAGRKDVPDAGRKNDPDAEQDRHSYWFQDKPPEKTIKGPIDVEPKRQVVIQTSTSHIEKGSYNFEIQFAGMDYDFEKEDPKKPGEKKPNEQMRKVEKLIEDAIWGVIADLEDKSLPKIEYQYPITRNKKKDKKAEQEARKAALNKALEQQKNIKMAQAPLKEPFSALTNHPLNIFIETVNNPSKPPNPQTNQIYVTPDDFGNPAKLQAGIRMPLVNLTGGDAGLKITKDGVQERTVEALSDNQAKEAIMHELMHTLLINKDASFNQVWEKVGSGMIDGPKDVKIQCEKLIIKYLRAQEEVFVYTHVGELYSEFKERNMERIELFISGVDAFLVHHSVEMDEKPIPLSDTKTEDKKKVATSISYKYPKAITVSADDKELIGELIKLDIGSH